ncbi:MAG: ROK family protein [Rubrobacter sp.]|jgi:glucokinase|nr:ROK family protein [Rubrobacter sp.]
MNSIGVDVGGTKIAAGVVDADGNVLDEVRYPSAGSPEVLIENIFRAVSEVRGSSEVGGVCLAVPGLILAQENKVVFSPNLPNIEGIPLKDELEARIEAPLTVENDASAAAWGEFRFGAGSGVDHLVFITLGTGVGGGVISHGVLLRGAHGAAGELGHTTIHATGPRCACGNRGCLEALASGSAIARRANEMAAERTDSALGKLAVKRKILGEDVSRLAREGDDAAISVLEEAGTWLGVGVASFVNVFNPEVVAVGGGASEAGELILSATRREVHLRARSPSRDLVRIQSATLGPESGVLGAAALARGGDGEYVLGDGGGDRA